MNYNIAIDGPAGAGKSTVAKAIAKKKGFIYVDTGAMYRAMALYFLREGIAAGETDKIEAACEKADISIDYADGVQIVLLNGENVNGLIRTEQVGNMASSSSVNPKVREKLVALQQKLAAEKSVVMDGRDICTKVLTDAAVKIYLTADTKVRAKRRYDELVEKGENCDIAAIEKDIQERDHRDMTRAVSPLVRAEDAVLVDSSNMPVEEVVRTILSISDKKSGE
ncbi:MAG TPA: (d)CMP kinase [Lachnospiraceae bacterium]|nr:(d)CMP kinase [Lachnospiraceae bacterium]